jgi:uncharacterized membrane protein
VADRPTTPAVQGSDGPRRRTLDPSRLEGFSDGVFALAATLLVVTLEVPSDYDELLETVAGFPAFGLAFASLISLWAGHRQFFAHHPLGDGWTVIINAVLLFIVVLYVYPLKLLAEVIANRFFWTSTDEVLAMDAGEVRGLYLIFGAALVAISFSMAALYLRAWQLRAERDLGPDDIYEIASDGISYLLVALLAAVGLAIAAADLGLSWGLPIWVLVAGSPVMEVLRQRHARRRAQEARSTAADRSEEARATPADRSEEGRPTPTRKD